MKLLLHFSPIALVTMATFAHGQSRIELVNEVNVNAVAASPTDAVIATAHGHREPSFLDKGHVAFWNLESAKQVGKVPGLGCVNVVQFSPNGKTLLAVGSMLHLIDMNSHKILHEFKVPGRVLAAAFSGDGKYIFATVAGEKQLFRWDAASKMPLEPIRSEQVPDSIALAPDSLRIAYSVVTEMGADLLTTMVDAEIIVKRSQLSGVGGQLVFVSSRHLFVGQDKRAFGGGSGLVDIHDSKITHVATRDRVLGVAAAHKGSLFATAEGAALNIWDGTDGAFRKSVSSLSKRSILSCSYHSLSGQFVFTDFDPHRTLPIVRVLKVGGDR